MEKRYCRKDSSETYYSFGYEPCDEYYAVGCIEHTRLGATRYYVNVSTLEARIWKEVSRDFYLNHLRSM